MKVANALLRQARVARRRNAVVPSLLRGRSLTQQEIPKRTDHLVPRLPHELYFSLRPRFAEVCLRAIFFFQRYILNFSSLLKPRRRLKTYMAAPTDHLRLRIGVVPLLLAWFIHLREPKPQRAIESRLDFA